jgi:glutathione synthase/RimK-type ligase-like ATP-grasp enzyme
VAGTATIAIFSLERDLHAHAIAHELRRRFGALCHFVATDRLFDRGGLVWDNSDNGSATGRLKSYDGEWFEVDALDAIWWRRVNQPLQSDDRLDTAEVRDFVQNEWRAALFGVVNERFIGTWVNRPSSDVLAGNKLYQLTAASGAGLHVPRTLISQDPREVRDFCRRVGGQVVAKKLHGVPGRPLATVVIAERDLDEDPSIQMCPAVYQEVVPGDRHVRANCFGDVVHSIMIQSEVFDWRRDLSVPFTPFSLGADLDAALVALLRVLDLRMGIMDLKITDDGQVVWLEVNPQGQFLFGQALSGVDLISAFAEFLMREAESLSS